ncbi:hypothetical protein T459_03668 [Capsicum annuum]|uniref:TF-B3 domain-containing protein n=1 Tax=Capsicum annuum TaxID=4072 RepID=A0A2G3ANH9_CAPAN|nr:hypothetical protein T459_03668 [Capsicum annuum]
MESEFIALDKAGEEAKWIQNFLEDIPYWPKPVAPKIPVGFLKYLKGQEHIEHAILKRDSKRWLIKLNDKRFEKGWGKFTEQNDVQLGDMLVFRHDGNMEFDVCIIDSTHCDREYAEYLHEE